MTSSKKRRHIAVIGTRGPCNFSGVETVCKELYPYLSKHYDVTIYSRSPYCSKSMTRHQGARVVHLVSGNNKHLEAFFHSFLATVHSMLGPADILHFHAQGPALFTFLPRLLTPWKTVVFTCHGLDWQRAKWSRFASLVIKAGEWCSARFPHVRTAVSNSLKDYYQHVYGRETHFIANGTQVSEAVMHSNILQEHGLEAGKYFLFLGRLVPEKAIDELMSAYKSLTPDERKGIKLVIAGGSSATNAYVESLHELKANDIDIVFTGFVEGAALSALYANAFWFISPSHLEGFNITAIEAMSHGSPVLLSNLEVHLEFDTANVSGQSQVVRYFETANVSALAGALKSLLQVEKHERLTLKKRARDFVQAHYQWQAIANHYEELINSAVEMKTRRLLS
jgi:glycosyltransferase involved in cell wall biosynthesis